MPEKHRIPTHIAFIMDGNGRWAKLRGFARTIGHKYGVDNAKKILRYCEKIGVRYVSLYAFSTENWNRPQPEVDALMDYFCEYLDDAIRDVDKETMRMRFIGDRSILQKRLRDRMDLLESLTSEKTGMTVCFAINYGGRDDIVYAVKNIARAVKTGEISSEDIDEQLISDNLYTKDIPDPDLLVRPSGELRISNFLLWQSAYTEFYFDKVLWPDYSERDIDRAVKAFNKRDRRFGAIKE